MFSSSAAPERWSAIVPMGKGRSPATNAGPRNVKSVAGDFAYEKALREVLKHSVAHVKARLAKTGRKAASTTR
jgi:hypothetical protein